MNSLCGTLHKVNNHYYFCERCESIYYFVFTILNVQCVVSAIGIGLDWWFVAYVVVFTFHQTLTL